MNIVLCGFKNCGKTTLGQYFAKKYHYQFVDTDDLLTNQHGCTVKELYQKLGEKGFRSAEEQAIADLEINQPSIIATGGGAVLSQSNVKKLKSLGQIIYLDVEYDLLVSRYTGDRCPEFFQHGVDDFDSYYNERHGAYLNIADKEFKVTTNNLCKLSQLIYYLTNN